MRIDCDIHPALPSLTALLPYLDAYWQDQVVSRGIDRQALDLTCYPPRAPLTARPDWRPAAGLPGASLDALREHVLDRYDIQIGILNLVHGLLAFHSDDLCAALCRAANDWLAAEWLDREPRLRASILVPMESPALAVAEIERRAADQRFVQVLLLVQGEAPWGRRQHWPIYATAEKHGLAVGIHAGSLFRHPPSSVGWHSYFAEDYVLQSQAFESALLSLLTEGVFQQHPGLKVVLIESGVTWLPGFLTRINKTWRGMRPEVPWMNEKPAETVRRHVRLTAQPLDAPADPAVLGAVLEQLGSDDMLLLATDYPHWQFDGDAVLPEGIPVRMAAGLFAANAMATYPRLAETLA